ncbi:hypothetical protein Tco_0286397 [Tanacetum coccineum]
MFCYVVGMEPYYLKCIKDGPFHPKTADGDDKLESQWTPDERRVVIQDQRLKSIFMPCLSDDIMEAKPTESLSQTYTRYKTLLNELANDGVNLSKHEINVGFVNSLLEKWLTFSQGLRNANHTQTLDLSDIYGWFDFQENSDDDVDERSSKEYLRDLDIDKSIYFSEPKDLPTKEQKFSSETFDWDEKEVSYDEEVTQVNVLMALADDELTVGKNYARNDE